MISVRNIDKSFGGVKVLKDLCFDIKRGEIVGLLGPNGAGKTTTMRLLTGFLSADKGKILINDRDIEKPEEAIKIKKEIGYLPEDNPLYPEMIVEEYLYMMGELKQITKDKLEEKVKKAISETGVESVYYKQISHLSKGFKQRVGLAASILGEPEIMILDEPTEGLDPNQRVDIRNLIGNLGKNKTVIISSHVLAEIENTCQRIIIMNQGKVVTDGNTQDVIDGAKGGKKIYLELEGKGVEEKLEELGVAVVSKTVREANRDRYILNIKDKKMEVRPKIFKLAKDNDWIIWEMHQKQVSLEDVFRDVTK